MRTLTPEIAEHFYHLHRHLILFTNERYQLYDGFKTVDDIKNLSQNAIQNGILPIRQIMYQSENIDNFCRENPYSLKEKDLSLVLNWKYKVSGDAYIVRHLSKYSVFLIHNNDTAQLYGVIGIIDDLEILFPSSYLPSIAKVTLLPFAHHIIYDGFVQSYNVTFGSGMKRSLREDYNQAKALHGIYSEYKNGNDLANPASTTTIKEQVEYSIKQSFKRGEYPRCALELAEQHGERNIFEQAYTKHYTKDVKYWVKDNDDIPPMTYAMYRESVIAVMPSKKEALAFCKKYYPDIVDYITIFKA